MDASRAAELVARERRRIEASLRELTGDVAAEADLARQQTGEFNTGSELATESLEVGLVEELRDRLAAVQRAEARIRDGTYGRSIESGLPISRERLEAEPLAERTVDEQRRFEEEAERGR
jgi:DnaK suppressor protein